MTKKQIESMNSDKLIEFLEHVSWPSLNVAISKKYGCLLIPEEKWELVSGTLFNCLGEENWKTEYEY